MTTNFATDNILRYDARHGVLICRECRYAVQKSALGGHLLRHKIYRGARQRLLSCIATLKVLEPDAVQAPPAGSPPVEGLPVLTGFRCAAAGCGNLCASSKRMRRHWADVHELNDPPEPWARPVHIQTFFRGTKLRYFEVATSGTEAEAVRPVPGTEQAQGRRRNLEAATEPLPQTIAASSGIDLEALAYFHHYITSTCSTLPTQGQDPAKCWQTDVVTQALRLPWLMHGLLAISARHLAALNGETVLGTHLDRSRRYLEEFSTGGSQLKRSCDIAQIQADEARIAAQMACIHRCCGWMLDTPDLFPVRTFVDTVRGCVDRDSALRSAVGSDALPESTSSETRDDGDGSGREKVPASVSERLRSLPLRMTMVVGKPKTALDFFAALSAIDALTECSSLSYVSDDVSATWSGMVAWLGRVSDHFKQMAWRREPSALVVLAHWLLLVERAEEHCWFLRGCVGKLRRQIVAELPQDAAFQELISGPRTVEADRHHNVG